MSENDLSRHFREQDDAHEKRKAQTDWEIDRDHMGFGSGGGDVPTDRTDDASLNNTGQDEAARQEKERLAQEAARAVEDARRQADRERTRRHLEGRANREADLDTLNRIGEVTHYYRRIGVAVICLSEQLSVGDEVCFKSPLSRPLHNAADLLQTITSMEHDGAPVQAARVGQTVAITVAGRVRVGDIVGRSMS